MKILVIRFSAMGDVILCHPVLSEVIRLNPEVRIDFLTRNGLEFIVKGIPNVNSIALKFKKGLSGFLQLLQLVKELRNKNYDAVIDLHGSIRSRLISILLFGGRKNIFRIDKGRDVKKARIGHLNIDSKPLRHHILRYRDVFVKAGLKLFDQLEDTISIRWSKNENLQLEIEKTMLENGWNDKKRIGIAAFAKHQWKEWNKTESFIEKILEEDGHTLIFLFGAGPAEKSKMLEWQKKSFGRVIIVGDYFTLQQEIYFFSYLDALVTMDSANLHLANLSNIPKIISIWGPTDPGMGFGPVDQKRNIFVQKSAQQLTCRPCSVYGNKKCHRGDHACMVQIEAEEILEHLS